MACWTRGRETRSTGWVGSCTCRPTITVLTAEEWTIDNDGQATPFYAGAGGLWARPSMGPSGIVVYDAPRTLAASAYMSMNPDVERVVENIRFRSYVVQQDAAQGGGTVVARVDWTFTETYVRLGDGSIKRSVRVADHQICVGTCADGTEMYDPATAEFLRDRFGSLGDLGTTLGTISRVGGEQWGNLGVTVARSC